MPAIYHHEHVVATEEIDALGHANNVAYVGWMQAAALAHSAAQGWPGDAYRALGAGWVVRSHTIRYLRSAVRGDTVVVQTWVATLKRLSSLRRYRMVRKSDGELLASAETEWAFIDLATGIPTRIPPQVIAAYELVPDESTP